MKSSLDRKWSFTHSPVFQESLERNAIVFNDLPEKLQKFKDVKGEDPLRCRYGKHDGPMTGRFKGYHHAHLRDDAILIYKLKNKAVDLVYISSHAEIEGKRCKNTLDRLSVYN
jgi:mRNA-degrading endonuclease YafQ of YafQ-DinJ toxin-antitoxin module